MGGGKKCTRGRDRVIKRHTNPPTMFTHAFVTTGLKITKQLRSTGLTWHYIIVLNKGQAGVTSLQWRKRWAAKRNPFNTPTINICRIFCMVLSWEIKINDSEFKFFIQVPVNWMNERKSKLADRQQMLSVVVRTAGVSQIVCLYRSLL